MSKQRERKPTLFMDGDIVRGVRGEAGKAKLASLPQEVLLDLQYDTAIATWYLQTGLDLGGLAVWATKRKDETPRIVRKRAEKDVQAFRRGMRAMGVADVDGLIATIAEQADTHAYKPRSLPQFSPNPRA